MKSKIKINDIRKISIIFMFSGLITILTAMYLHQDIGGNYSGEFVKVRFDSRPYLDYEARVIWESGPLTSNLKAVSENQSGKIVNPANTHDNREVRINVLNHANQLVISEIVKPGIEARSNVDEGIPESVVRIPPDGFHIYTVIFEQIRNPISSPSSRPNYCVSHSPMSSEGNAIFPFLVGSIGVLLVYLGVYVAIQLYRSQKVRSN